jgi:hypothetical protein
MVPTHVLCRWWQRRPVFQKSLVHYRSVCSKTDCDRKSICDRKFLFLYLQTLQSWCILRQGTKRRRRRRWSFPEENLPEGTPPRGNLCPNWTPMLTALRKRNRYTSTKANLMKVMHAMAIHNWVAYVCIGYIWYSTRNSTYCK